MGNACFLPLVGVRQDLILRPEQIWLVQTYQMIQNQYEHLKWMAKRVPVDMATRYRAAMTPWRGSSAATRRASASRCPS